MALGPRLPKSTTLSIEQQAALGSGDGFWHTKALPDSGIPAIMVADGPHGLRKQSTGGDNLGILDGEPATCFPPAVALGSSWDVELVERVGRALGQEARSKQVSVLLGPGINLKRDPRCGRNFEYLSEDPVHSGILGVAFVNGVQSQGIGTSLKHFAVNNQEEDRLRISAEVDERTLRELYLRAFQRVVTEARPWTVMCSYNRINGVFASENEWLLTQVLREEWGFEGLVVSDWGAVHDRAAAVRAGLDLEMPGADGRSDAVLVEAVRSGALDAGFVAASAQRVLDLLKASLPKVDARATVDLDAQHALAREAAGRSVVLLKNEGALLPLDAASGRIAVIGELARTPRYQGAGSSQIVPTRLDNALDALQEQAAGATITFDAGYRLDGEADAALEAAAIAAAGTADTVLYFMGLPDEAESEGFDREHIALPEAQRALLARLHEANARIAVVLSNGGVVTTSEWEQHAPAILEGWLLGQAGGGALAEVVYGTVNPSGKLTETIPLRLQDVPAYLHFPGGQGAVHYGEGLHIGYRYYDSRELEVSYPFGHGLSYTSFEYREVKVKAGRKGIEASLEVHNTGRRDGIEVVQLYTGLPAGEVSRPVHELRAFAAVHVPAGGRARVKLQVPREDLGYYSVREGRWLVEGGEYLVELAASSRDIRHSSLVSMTGDALSSQLDADNTIGEWLKHPVGGPLLQEAMDAAVEADPGLKKLLNNPIVMQMAKQMPLKQLATFEGSPVGQAEVEALVERARG